MAAPGERAISDGVSSPRQNGFLKDAAASLPNFDALLQLQPRPARGSPGIIGPQSILARKGANSVRRPSPVPDFVPIGTGYSVSRGDGLGLPMNGTYNGRVPASAPEMPSISVGLISGSAARFQQPHVGLAAEARPAVGSGDNGAAAVAVVAAAAANAPSAALLPDVTAAMATTAAPAAAAPPASSTAAVPAAAASVAAANGTTADVGELRRRLEQATLQAEHFETAEKQLLAQGNGLQAGRGRGRRPQQAKGKSAATGTRIRHSVADDDAEYTGGSASSSDDADFDFDGRHSPIVPAPTRRQPGRKRKLSATGSGGGRAGTLQPPAVPPYANGDYSAAAHRRRQNGRIAGSGGSGGGSGGASGGSSGGRSAGGGGREGRNRGAGAASNSGAPITIAGYVSEDDAILQEAPLAEGEELVLPTNAVTMLLAASVVRSLGSGPKTDVELRQAARRDLERCRPCLPALGQEPVLPDTLDVWLVGDVLQALGLVRREVSDAASAAAVAEDAGPLHAPSEAHGGEAAPCACRGIFSYATSVLGQSAGAVLSRSGKGRAHPTAAAAAFAGDGIGAAWGSLSDNGGGGSSGGGDAAELTGFGSTETIAAALAAAVDAPALGALLEANLGGMVEWDWGGVNWDYGGDPTVAAVTVEDGPEAAAARAGLGAAVAAAVRQAQQLLREGRWNPFVVVESPGGSSEESAASAGGLPSAADSRALEDLAMGAGSEFGEPGAFSASATADETAVASAALEKSNGAAAGLEEAAAMASADAAAAMEMDLQESAVAAAAAEAAEAAAAVDGSNTGSSSAAAGGGGENGDGFASEMAAEGQVAGSGDRGGIAAMDVDLGESGGGGGGPSPLRLPAAIEPLPLAAPTPRQLPANVSGGGGSSDCGGGSSSDSSHDSGGGNDPSGGGGGDSAAMDLDVDVGGEGGGGSMTPAPLTLGDNYGGWENRLGGGADSEAPLTPGSTRNLSAAAAAAAGVAEDGTGDAPASPWVVGSASAAAMAAAEATGLAALSGEATLAGSLRELSVGGVPGNSSSGGGGGGYTDLISPRRQPIGGSWPGAIDATIAAASRRAPFLTSPLVVRSPAALKSALAAFLGATAPTVGAGELSSLEGGGASACCAGTVLPAHVRCLADEGLFDIVEVAWGAHRLQQVYAYLAEASDDLPLSSEAFRLAMDGEVYPGSALEKKFGRAVQEVLLLWLHTQSSDWIEWRDRQDPIRIAAAAEAAAAAAAAQPPPVRQRSSSGGSFAAAAEVAAAAASKRATRYRIDPAQDAILPCWRRKARRLAAMELEAARLALREETMLRELCKRCGVALPPGYTRADALRRLRLGVPTAASSAAADRSAQGKSVDGGGDAATAPAAAIAGHRRGAGFTPGLSAMALLKKAGLQEPPPSALAASAAAAAASATSSSAAGGATAGDSDTECGPRLKRKLSQGGAFSSSAPLAGAAGGAARVLPHAVPPMDLRPRMARYPGGGGGKKRSRGASLASFPLGGSSADGRGSERASTPRPRYDDDDDSGANAAAAVALASREWGRSGIDDVMLVTRATPWEDVSRQFMPVQDLSSNGVGGSSAGTLTALPRQGSNDPDWEEMALQNRSEIVRRVSSAGTAGVGGEIYAPSFRFLSSGGGATGGGGVAEGGESSGEEDISDEAYLSRHAEHLEHMREKMDAARKAREALASPRQPGAGRSSKKTTPRSSWDSKGGATPGSSAPPTPGGTVAGAGLRNSWSFAAAAIGGKSTDGASNGGRGGKAAVAGNDSSYGFGLGLCGETPGNGVGGGGGGGGSGSGSPAGTVWLGGAAVGTTKVSTATGRELPDNGPAAGAAADGVGGKAAGGKRLAGKRKGSAGQRAATPPTAPAAAVAAAPDVAAPLAEGELSVAAGATVGAGVRQNPLAA